MRINSGRLRANCFFRQPQECLSVCFQNPGGRRINLLVIGQLTLANLRRPGRGRTVFRLLAAMRDRIDFIRHHAYLAFHLKLSALILADDCSKYKEILSRQTKSRDVPAKHSVSWHILFISPTPTNIHRNSLLGKSYPFDILLTEKRSACFVASAPFEVPVIQFRVGFGSRYVFFRLISLLQKMGKSREKLLYAQYAPINPTRDTRQWTAAAHRPERPRWRLPVPGR
mgnify:CR=1 FL=1